MVSRVAEALAKIAASEDKAAGFEWLLKNIKEVTRPEHVADDLNTIIAAVFASSLGNLATRSVLNTFVETLEALDMDEVTIAVAPPTLAAVGGTQAGASYVEQVVKLRTLLASAHESRDEFSEAAAVLVEIPLDSSQRKVTDEERARVWVRIVRNLLEAGDDGAGGDAVTAEAYLNKAKNVMHKVTDRDLRLHFGLSEARILDARREFLLASRRYHEISQSPLVVDEERLRTLSMAVKCAVLAPAGPWRSRALGSLYKDERAPELDEFPILEKMYLDRLLSRDEVAAFAKTLQPHQLATTADGSTVLEKAVIEHNLLGVSRIYANISIAGLAALLGLSEDRTEETTARMIEQGRLLGRIDQVEQFIWFEKGEASGQKGSRRAEPAVAREIRRWDANIESLSEEVDAVTSALQKENPDFVAAHLLI